MSLKFRLILMNFLQFFVWGAWLISIGGYLGGSLHFTGVQIGSVFFTLGLASCFMPALMGIVADKWMNAERVLGICHLVGALLLFWASTVKDPDLFFWVMLLNSMFYMPTIALNNTVSYIILEKNGFDIVKDFPPIRVWGTVGFIAAMWIVDITGWKASNMQLVFSGVSAVSLGLFVMTMPACPPVKSKMKKTLLSSLGLDAFVLFKDPRMLAFFVFSMFLGAALQITNAFGGSFLSDFSKDSQFQDSFVVKHEILTLSISQISESLFILAIPFFLQRFGIKKVMMMSIAAWVLRFGFFALGDPGSGLYLLILSMIIYGMAFDFFNISGSLFVEQESPSSIRASAQGLFMFMTNGLGSMIGGYGSGLVVDYFTEANGFKAWSKIWGCFSLYALALFIVFPIFFRYKHDPDAMGEVRH